MLRRTTGALLFLFTIIGVETAAAQSRPLAVVDSLDIVKFMGKWHEVARLPNPHQKDCVSDVTAHYTLRGDGEFEVINQCVKEDGTVSRSEGTARNADPDLPMSVMEVRFAPGVMSWLPSAWGDYWVLAVEGDYAYALVGTPDRKNLWLLSRHPAADEEVVALLLQYAQHLGFDTRRVELTLHTGDPRT